MKEKTGFIRKISIFMIVLLVVGLIVPALSIEAGVKKGYYLLNEYFEDGVTVVAYLEGKNKPKYFIMDDKGKMTEIKYDKVGYFDKGLLKVEKNEKLGCVNKEGKEVIPPEYDDITISDSYVKIIKDENTRYVDKEGKEIAPPSKNDGEVKSNQDLILINKNEKYGFVDKEGREVIPLKYDYAENFSEGLAVVEKDKK